MHFEIIAVLPSKSFGTAYDFIFKRQYTIAANDDAATYTANPPAGQYQIRMNIGICILSGP